MNEKEASEKTNTPKNSYTELLERFNTLAKNYAGFLSPEALYAAFGRAGEYWQNQPTIQNARVKGISSLPVDFTKEEIGNMLRNPYGSEKPLRQTSEILRWTAYPYFKITKTYQDISTYRHYIKPLYLTKDQGKTEDFLREAQLLDKLNKELDIHKQAHKITGQALTQGKVFYTHRVKADKAHNKIDYAFIQQLPEDWCEIIGFNNVSGYTVSFNLMYFLQAGTDTKQFGDLFEPYLFDFNSIFEEEDDTINKKYVYSSMQVSCKGRTLNIHPEKLRKNAVGDPRIFRQDGRWCYYVSLPIDKVWTFEIDDTTGANIPSLSGLMLTYAQQSDYEAAQLSLLLNPLIMLLTGEMDFFDDTGSNISDNYRLSNGGRLLFETLFYEMLAKNNTSGVGWFSAPVKNIKSHSFPESANANDVSQSFSEYAAGKSGLAGLIPVSSNDIKASQVDASMKIESRFATATIYPQFCKMINSIYNSLNLKYNWEFQMFGTIFTEDKIRENAQKAFDKGDTSALFILSALDDQSWIDKLSMVRAINQSGIMDEFRVPETAYTQSGKVSEKGRPTSEGITSEAKEKAIDAGISENE